MSAFYIPAKNNRWMRYFTALVRIALGFGFFTAGMVKIMGERFASGLSVNHPMGHYLEALHVTGFYYPFIGVVQVIAALLLLIPRTALLGALIYFPVILNICILSISVRFEGSLVTSPLMVIANLYLLFWDYERIRPLFPFKQAAIPITDNHFPLGFFSIVVLVTIIVFLSARFAFDITPRNSISDCKRQCSGSKNPRACEVFCGCVHTKGQPLDECLEEYHQALKTQAGHQAN